MTEYFSVSSIFLIKSDNILSCYMIILQHSPPMGHVVTFNTFVVKMWISEVEKVKKCTPLFSTILYPQQ